MDHLKTDEERQDRWYSRNRRPRYVPVVPASDWKELQDDDEYKLVKSIPYEWLMKDSAASSDLNIKSILEKHGFAVVSGVLSSEECEHSLNLAWDWIRAASAVEQVSAAENFNQAQLQAIYDESMSMSNSSPEYLMDSEYFPRCVEGGILPFYGSGHSSFAWTVRSNPKVKAVFESIHGTSDLISSLDGVVLWRPGEKHRTDPGWFHVDQNPLEKPGFEAVQGLVNLLPVTPSSGGNVLVAQSNRLFPDHYLRDRKDFYKDRLVELDGDDWMEIPHDDSAMFSDDDDSTNKMLFTCLLNPGDMLLWDSRTVHCSYPGDEDVGAVVHAEQDPQAKNKTAGSRGLIRAASLVSMMPSSRATREVLDRRRQAVNRSRTLTHWADQAAFLGEERGGQAALEASHVRRIKSLQGAAKVLLDFDDLTPDQKRLVLSNI